IKIAREGGQMQAADLAKFESKRRYATLVALVSESKATIIDEIIDLHDRIIGKIFNKAKNKHQQVFSASGKSINEKVELYTRIGKALIQAKQQNIDPFDAIENIISWEAFTQSVDDAESLVQPNDFDFLPRINDSYQTIRRYAPAMLDILPLQATSSSNSLMQAIEVLRTMNKAESRKLPDNPPTK
ncbi:Tn3 family transposase, partial [Alkalihalobacillus clausii]|nr:Tn3 family transposase [Shouchella clausii]